MTSSTANPLLLSYFQRQQTPAGWFDLLSVMVDGMVRNVGKRKANPSCARWGHRWRNVFLCLPHKPLANSKPTSTRCLRSLIGAILILMPAKRDYRSAIRGYRFPGMRTARRVGVTHFAPYWKGFIPVGCRDRAGNRISLLAANGFTPYRTLCSATLTHNESEYV